jgi:hypothetical protein
MLKLELRLSPTGIPYIDFDERNRIAFCRSTAGKIGYKHFIIKADIIETHMDKKTKRISKVPSQAMLMLDIDLKGLPNVINKTNPFMKRKVLSHIANKVKKYVIDGEFPFDKIDKLRKDLVKPIKEK